MGKLLRTSGSMLEDLFNLVINNQIIKAYEKKLLVKYNVYTILNNYTFYAKTKENIK